MAFPSWVKKVVDTTKSLFSSTDGSSSLPKTSIYDPASNDKSAFDSGIFDPSKSSNTNIVFNSSNNNTNEQGSNNNSNIGPILNTPSRNIYTEKSYSTDNNTLSSGNSSNSYLTEMNQGLTRLRGITDLIAGKDVTLTGNQDAINQMRGMRPENPYDKYLKSGIEGLADYAGGNSKVDRTIANRMLGKFDASQSAASLAQAQRTASNPYLSTGAKQLAVAELGRQMGAQRSDLVGQMAQGAQERAYTATQALTSASLGAAQYEESKYQSDLKNVSDDLTRQLNQLMDIGTLTSNEVSAHYNVWSKQLEDENTKGQLALEKIKTDDNHEYVQKQMEALDATMYDTYQKQVTTTLNTLEASTGKLSTDLTVDEVRNDANSYNAIKKLWEKSGQSGEPSDAYIQSMIKSSPSQAEKDSQARRLAVQDRVNYLVSASKMTKEQAQSYVDFMNLADMSGGTMSFGNDGTITVKLPDQTLTISSTGVITSTTTTSTGSTTLPTGGKISVTVPTEVGLGRAWLDDSGYLMRNTNGNPELLNIGKDRSIGDTVSTETGVYEVISNDGKLKELTYSPDDIWSDTNTKILNAWGEANPYADQLLQKRYTDAFKNTSIDIFKQLDSALSRFEHGDFSKDGMTIDWNAISNIMKQDPGYSKILSLPKDDGVVKMLFNKIQEKWPTATLDTIDPKKKTWKITLHQLPNMGLYGEKIK